MLISLCMIVRDEQDMLPDCLASVAGAVDEIIVVDTGSVDGTVDIAEAAGARVVHFTWCDDFAAARNAALPEVRGQWVLMLDADERLAPGAGSALRAAAEKGDLDCGMLPLYDADRLDASPAEVLSGGARTPPPVLLPRMFRRTEDLCWQGMVHEAPIEWMKVPGRVFTEVDAAIIHFGNVETYRVDKDKGQRNLRLLEQQCEREPNNPTARGYLASELVSAGDVQRATAEVERAWHCLVEVLERPREGPGPAGVQVASLRADLAIRSANYEKAIETADTWDRIGLRHPNLVVLRAMSLRRQSQSLPQQERAPLLEMAIAGLEWAVSVEEQNFAEWVIPQARGGNVATELGVALLLDARPAEALAAFQRAVALQPEMSAAKLGIVEALYDAGRIEEALSALQPMLADGGADEWALASCICLSLGANQDAITFYETALQHGTPGSQVSYRKERFDELATVFEPVP